MNKSLVLFFWGSVVWGEIRGASKIRRRCLFLLRWSFYYDFLLFLLVRKKPHFEGREGKGGERILPFTASSSSWTTRTGTTRLNPRTSLHTTPPPHTANPINLHSPAITRNSKGITTNNNNNDPPSKLPTTSPTPSPTGTIRSRLLHITSSRP